MSFRLHLVANLIINTFFDDILNTSCFRQVPIVRDRYVLSLPQNVFLNAGAGVKTNLLFFTKGKPTEKIWYYDMSDIKVLKKSPMTLNKFDDFLNRLHSDEEGDKISEKSWFVEIDEVKKKNYDIKAVNPNIKEKEIPKPEELIKIIEEAQIKINEGLQKLKEIS